MAKKANPIQFFREVRQEVDRITWPTRKETVLTTVMVFIMVLLVAVFLMVADQVLAVVIQWILGINS